MALIFVANDELLKSEAIYLEINLTKKLKTQQSRLFSLKKL